MKKDELINEVAERTGLSKKDVKTVTDEVFTVIQETVATGDTYQVPKFGTFKLTHRAERKGRNPQTNKEITIPASNAITFKMSSSLKGQL